MANSSTNAAIRTDVIVLELIAFPLAHGFAGAMLAEHLRPVDARSSRWRYLGTAMMMVVPAMLDIPVVAISWARWTARSTCGRARPAADLRQAPYSGLSSPTDCSHTHDTE